MYSLSLDGRLYLHRSRFGPHQERHERPAKIDA